MLRRVLPWMLSALALGVGLGIGSRWLPPAVKPEAWFAPAADVHRHTGPTLEQLLPLSSLVMLRVEVSDVLETRVHGLTGGVTAVILIKGDVELATDLALARFEDVDPARRVAVLVLPEPEVGAARLDHEKTRLVALVREGLWDWVPGDYADKSVVNKAYAEAQAAVTEAADVPKLRDRARVQTEVVLGAFFETLGWRVRICWDERP